MEQLHYRSEHRGEKIGKVGHAPDDHKPFDDPADGLLRLLKHLSKAQTGLFAPDEVKNQHRDTAADDVNGGVEDQGFHFVGKRDTGTLHNRENDAGDRTEHQLSERKDQHRQRCRIGDLAYLLVDD